MDEFSTMGCAELAGVAAELALGALTGRERAAALAHLDQCEACQEKVGRLMITSGKLLELLPAGESPPGFEARVLERLVIPAAGAEATTRAAWVRRLCRRLGRMRD
jgi:hypothetical protein